MRYINHLIVFVCLYGFITVASYAQKPTSTASDPKAKVILDKLKKEYNNYKTMEVQFQMDLELPNKPIETQKGVLIQDNKKFKLAMKEQEIYSDGKNTWIYLISNKEVQILDAMEDSQSDFMSPKKMMTIYESGDYQYAIVDERNVGGQQFVDIEFKPLSKKVEFSKIRLTVDKKSNKMIALRMFLKDGSRYTLKMNNLITNKKYDASLFVLNTKALKGVQIEDLRLN